MIKAAIFADDVPWYSGDIVEYVYGNERINRIASLTDLYPQRITSGNLIDHLHQLGDLDVLFTCWGMFPFEDNILNQLPKLRAVFHAGGSVASFAENFHKRGIIVCNANNANAIPVAEFCLAQILLSCKGAWSNSLACRRGPWHQAAMPTGPGVYGETIALLGIGAVSRYLLKLLAPFRLRVIAISDYLTPEQAHAMGIAALVDLDTAFREAYVISNHLPDHLDTEGILNKHHFESMRAGAVFINTGRGRQVNEKEMIEVLKRRSDLTALLDVQYPEPPRADSPLYSMPNIHLTSHIAGSVNDEVRRMADAMIVEFLRWRDRQALENEVIVENLFKIERSQFAVQSA